MKSYKTLIQDDEVVIPVPSFLKLEGGEKFVVVKGEDGSFIYIPKEENIFKKAFKEGKSLRIEKEK